MKNCLLMIYIPLFMGIGDLFAQESKKIDKAPEKKIQKLIKNLKDKNYKTRNNAVIKLRRFGRKAVKSIYALGEFLKINYRYDTHRQIESI